MSLSALIKAGFEATNNDLNLVIDNKSGVIKSDNNITIHAKTLNNTAYHYDTTCVSFRVLFSVSTVILRLPPAASCPP
jgi:hypothetical protein